MRRSLIVGNWKMNGSKAANSKLLAGLTNDLQDMAGVDAAVCPPYLYLAQATELLHGKAIDVGAQDLSVHASGAYTGEVSSTMLADMDCKFVIVGHSERREYHGETDQVVAHKFAAALSAGLSPILCVGETLTQREAEETLDVIGRQIQAVIEHSGLAALAKAVVAYEPIWAIGTGLTASPEQAQQVHTFIRKQLAEVGDSVQILYGGSVKPNNATELFGQSDIDGALVGGASLTAGDFVAICKAAKSQ